jgi:hypothetical protein
MNVSKLVAQNTRCHILKDNNLQSNISLHNIDLLNVHYVNLLSNLLFKIFLTVKPWITDWPNAGYLD